MIHRSFGAKAYKNYIVEKANACRVCWFTVTAVRERGTRSENGALVYYTPECLLCFTPFVPARRVDLPRLASSRG